MIVMIPRIELVSVDVFLSLNSFSTLIFFPLDVTISPNALPNDEEDYPTIEADLNALEAPMQKSLSSGAGASGTPRQFGCSSFCYNQGVCVLSGQAIACRCAPGFIGTRCQVARKIERFSMNILVHIFVVERIGSIDKSSM